MTTRNAGIDGQRIRRLVVTPIDPGGTDRDLLRRFGETSDATAFEAFVRRHGAMVSAVARRVLGNAHDAEDVCQAAFLLLAQKAGGRWHPSVANWLHQTAHLLALKARRTAGRRAVREAKAAKPAADSLADVTGQELLAALDEELLALPVSLRAPLVLCYLEGSTRDKAAERLACPLSTLKKRLERGRARLHDVLVRRGLSLSAALGVLLVGSPAAFARRTTDAVLELAAGGAVPDRVSQLMNGGIAMAGGNKIKAALGVVLLGGLLAAGAGASHTQSPPPAVPAKPAEVAAGTMRVIVLDPQGKPVAGAKVFPSIWTDEKDYKNNREVLTDDTGVAAVPLPKTFTTVRLWASKPPFASLHTSWEQNELARGKGLPAEYTFRMGAAVSAGGRVVDAQGKPVAGAKLDVSLTNGNDLKPVGGDGRARFSYSLASGKSAATTDADGRWKVDTVPDHPEAELSLLVSHPYFVWGEWERPAKNLGISRAALRDGSAVITLKAGVIVRGRVTDPDGKPVKDARVIHGDDPYGGRKTTTFSTDADGRYRLPALPPGETSLTVIAPGFAPQLRKVDLKTELAPQDFKLEAGKLVRLRITDTAGNPIPKIDVWLKELNGSKSIYSDWNTNHPKPPATGIPSRADADGVWAWQHAPDGPVKVSIYANGFRELELDVTGGSTDQTVTLKAEHRISGTVTDATTGRPIPAFTVVPLIVFRKDHLHADRGHALAAKAGRFDYLADRTTEPLRVRIEAPGYRSQSGPEFRVGDDANRTQDFKLVPSPSITGVVADTGGKPVAKAAVYLATPTDEARVSDERNWVFTDAAGRFTFPDGGEPFVVVVQTEAGFAQAEFPAGKADVGTITPRAWASVRGTFRDGGKAVAGATVFVTPIRVDTLDRPRIACDYQTATGPDGGFEFPRVPPGPVSVRVYLGPWDDPGYRSGPSVTLNLKPGEKVALDVGAGGATVTGKVKLTGKVPADMDCTYSLNYLVRREPGVAPPPDVAAAGFDARKGWRDAWHQSREGLAYLSTLRSWFVKLAPDGSFRVSGVPPGEYDLAVAVYAKPIGCLTDPLARKVVRVTVTGADDVQVPDVAAEVVPLPAVGDTPALSFNRTDGKAGTLADYRGKYTVVHFWASWCGPCKKELPALKKLNEAFVARGLAVVSLSLDDDPNSWRAALKGLDLPWAQGRLNGDGATVVSGVPAYWLLDPTGNRL